MYQHEKDIKINKTMTRFHPPDANHSSQTYYTNVTTPYEEMKAVCLGCILVLPGTMKQTKQEKHVRLNHQTEK